CVRLCRYILRTVHCLPVGLHCSLCYFRSSATTQIYTLSLHDALPISAPICATNGSHGLPKPRPLRPWSRSGVRAETSSTPPTTLDRKSTRLNSSHVKISYAVFCLKKKKKAKNLIDSVRND